jgi:co-chaperonin GroES (HSP10)
MSQAVLAEGIKQLQQRVEKENRDKSAQTITLDGSNVIQFPGYPYTFEALGEKIIVSIDIFKSGYECKRCLGKRKIEEQCVCETSDRPGFKYSQTMIVEFNKLGGGGGDARENIKCPECNGDYLLARKAFDCPDCKGRGAMIIIPETSKNLPTTGVVVSMGSQCDKDKLAYKLGDRVLFSPYAGTMIPTKAGLMFKTMESTAPMAKIGGGSDLAAFDFIIQEDE